MIIAIAFLRNLTSPDNNQLTIKSCDITNSSEFSAKMKASGTLYLQNDKITGTIDRFANQSGTLPIDLQYVSE